MRLTDKHDPGELITLDESYPSPAEGPGDCMPDNCGELLVKFGLSTIEGHGDCETIILADGPGELTVVAASSAAIDDDPGHTVSVGDS